MSAHELKQQRDYAGFDFRTRLFVRMRVFQYRRAMYSKKGMPNKRYIGWMNDAVNTHGPIAAMWVINESQRCDEIMVGSSNGYRLYRNPAFMGETLLRALPIRKRVVERVYGQIVADMREECHDAISANDALEYRRALLRGRLALVWASIKLIASALGKTLAVWRIIKFLFAG